MQEYNICYSLDSAYVEQLAVSIASILKNADINENINFYILDGGLTKKDKKEIESLKNIKNFNIEYLSVNSSDFSDYPLLKKDNIDYKDYHVTLPTYFRFKLPGLLNSLSKVLYLDCDVIINLGTHGTLEWLPGRNVGVHEGDWSGGSGAHGTAFWSRGMPPEGQLYRQGSCPLPGHSRPPPGRGGG